MQNNPFEGAPREVIESMVSQLKVMSEGLQNQIQELREGSSSRPNTSEVKVENTKQQYHNRNESYNTQTTNSPPTPPNSSPDSKSKPKANATVVNNKLPNTVKSSPDLQKASKFLKNNRGKIALGALGVGIAKSFVDGEDDSLVTSAEKGIKTAVFTTGAAYAGKHVFKSQTVQDLVKGEVADVSKTVRKKVDTERKSQMKAGKIGAAYRIGMIALAGATALDVAQRYGDKRDAERLKQQQEYDLKKKQKRMKQKNKEKSYGHIDSGEIVFEMFNARSGHHKMGNAKFY